MTPDMKMLPNAEAALIEKMSTLQVEEKLTKESRTFSMSTAATSTLSSGASVSSTTPAENFCIANDAILTLEVPARGPEMEKNEQFVQWIKQVEDCSEVAFGGNCLDMISKKSKFKLGILSTPTGDMLGFVIYKFNRNARSLTIGKVAVRLEFRGQGYGKRIVKEVVKLAKKDKMIDFVSLSALPEAIKFYKRLNFKAFEDIKLSEDNLMEGEEFVEGQVYMEFKTGRGKRR